jgi:hypothetical protein
MHGRRQSRLATSASVARTTRLRAGVLGGVERGIDLFVAKRPL